MNRRAHAKRTASALVALAALGGFGCHNTWQGVKEDTRHAVHETGHGVEKAGRKMEGADRKKSAPPPTTDSAPENR
jgi:predicted small secreted protein